MKKITKKDLRGLKQLFPLQGKAEMRHYVGDYSNGYFEYYDSVYVEEQRKSKYRQVPTILTNREWWLPDRDTRSFL